MSIFYFLYILDTKLLSDGCVTNNFYQFIGFFFARMMVSFDVQKHFSLLRSYLFTSDLSTCAISVFLRKSVLFCWWVQVFFLLSCLSCSEYLVDFVQDNRYGSTFTFLDVAIAFEQHHLLKMVSLQCVFMASLSKFRYLYECSCMHPRYIFTNQHICTLIMPITRWFCYCISITQLEIWECDTSQNFFIIQDCFSHHVIFIVCFLSKWIQHCILNFCVVE